MRSDLKIRDEDGSIIYWKIRNTVSDVEILSQKMRPIQQYWAVGVGKSLFSVPEVVVILNTSVFSHYFWRLYTLC